MWFILENRAKNRKQICEIFSEIARALKTERLTAAIGETVQIDMTLAVREWTSEQQSGHTIQVKRLFQFTHRMNSPIFSY